MQTEKKSKDCVWGHGFQGDIPEMRKEKERKLEKGATTSEQENNVLHGTGVKC